MNTAIDLSKYIVTKCTNEEHPISNLQLQKILYYIQKDFLQRDSVAFSDSIEAWQFGPVVPSVYYRFSGFGAMPITAVYDVDFRYSDFDKERIHYNFRNLCCDCISLYGWNFIFNISSSKYTCSEYI